MTYRDQEPSHTRRSPHAQSATRETLRSLFWVAPRNDVNEGISGVLNKSGGILRKGAAGLTHAPPKYTNSATPVATSATRYPTTWCLHHRNPLHPLGSWWYGVVILVSVVMLTWVNRCNWSRGWK